MGAELGTPTTTPASISREKQLGHCSFSVMCKIPGTTRKEEVLPSPHKLWSCGTSGFPRGVMAARRTLLSIFIHEKILRLGSAQLWVLLAQGRR